MVFLFRNMMVTGKRIDHDTGFLTIESTQGIGCSNTNAIGANKTKAQNEISPIKSRKYIIQILYSGSITYKIKFYCRRKKKRIV